MCNRDTEALLRIVYKVLLPKRVQVHSISEVFDPYTPLGKVMLTIGGSVSTSAGLEAALTTWDAFPARWLTWQAAA